MQEREYRWAMPATFWMIAAISLSSRVGFISKASSIDLHVLGFHGAGRRGAAYVVGGRPDVPMQAVAFENALDRAGGVILAVGNEGNALLLDVSQADDPPALRGVMHGCVWV